MGSGAWQAAIHGVAKHLRTIINKLQVRIQSERRYI